MECADRSGVYLGRGVESQWSRMSANSDQAHHALANSGSGPVDGFNVSVTGGGAKAQGTRILGRGSSFGGAGSCEFQGEPYRILWTSR